jgi:hypothetical protein
MAHHGRGPGHPKHAGAGSLHRHLARTPPMQGAEFRDEQTQMGLSSPARSLIRGNKQGTITPDRIRPMIVRSGERTDGRRGTIGPFRVREPDARQVGARRHSVNGTTRKPRSPMSPFGHGDRMGVIASAGRGPSHPIITWPNSGECQLPL